MKKLQILSLFFVLYIVSAPNNYLFAQNPTLTAGADLVSRYIWRGADINNQPNVQPSITFEYGGLQAGLWGSYGFGHLNPVDTDYKLSSEIDTWLGYSVDLSSSLNATLLITDYYFPNAGIKIGNFNNYDNINGPGAHTIEAGIILAGSQSFPISLSGYMNIYNDKGNNVYVQADYSTAINEIDIAVFAGAAAGTIDNPGYYGTDKFNVINVGVKVSKTVKITENYSLPVYCSYILNPQKEIAFFVLGISI